jgi:trigger factor
LKIETQPREDHQVTLTVEVEAEQFEAARRRAARQIAGKAKIPGFRPGKAPFEVVRRTYGDSAINESAVELLVDEIYPQALKEANITPAAIGQLDNLAMEPLPKFTFTVPLAPTVALGDYRSVRLPYNWVAPGDDALEAELMEFRRMNSKIEVLERASQDGDFVSVDVVGRKAGVDEPLLERKGFTVLVREAIKEKEWPFSGFATHLLGLKIGETKEFAYQFASDHEDEALQGQDVQFTVQVNNVRGLNLVELTDELVQKNGVGQTVEDLREQVRRSLETQSRNDYDDEYFEQLLEQIKAGATIKYPPQVLEHEVEHVLQDFERQIKSQGAENLDVYYKSVDTTKEAFEAERVRPVAQKHLERSLIMEEVARVEKIELDEASLEQEFRNTWTTLAMTDEEFSKRTQGGTKPTRELVEAISMTSANRLMTRRTLMALKAIATGEADVVESVEATEEAPVAEPAQPAVEASTPEVPAEPAPEVSALEPAPEAPTVAETALPAEPAPEAPAKKSKKKKTE